MKKFLSFLLCSAAGTVGLVSAFAQFNSGSTGADGPLDVTNNLTLNLPPDGIFHFTTITVGSNVTLRFNRNPLNTPVHLLATGDVAIFGTINVAGENGLTVAGGLGGPGGFKGGEPPIPASFIPAGAGQGPGGARGGTEITGAGRAGSGGYAVPGATSVSTNNGGAYGTPLLIPLIGGSGGGGRLGSPSQGGGGGGGAILVASTTRIELRGSILAQAGSGAFNLGHDGSGGAIRLVAPNVLGNGILNVVGGGSGGYGRIRIDALDRTGMNFTFNPGAAATVGVTMLAIPSPLPRLDLIEVAGTPIVAGTPMPVSVVLPFGSDPDRTVMVQARDFNAVVPIEVVLTPEHGEPLRVNGQINNLASNPAQTTVNVTLGTNAPTAVQVWTR